MSLAFLTPEPAGTDSRFAPAAQSPMEHAARAAGARFAVRDGWNVAVSYGAEDGPREAAPPVTWADASHLGTLELQVPTGQAAALARVVEGITGGSAAGPGDARRAAGAWWCPVTPERLLVLSDPGRIAELRAAVRTAAAGEPAVSIIEVTTAFAALVVAGPQARETIARFCALDLRPHVTPVAAFRPGSVARTPGYVLCEAPGRYLLLFGAAFGHHLWTVVADAAVHLGGAPCAFDALDPVRDETEAEAHA